MARFGQLGRVIEGEVQASAFTALQRAIDDELSYLDQVAEFEQPRLDAEVPVIFPDFVR